MRRLLAAASLAVLLAFLAATSRSAAAPPTLPAPEDRAPDARFGEAIDVRLFTVVVRVVDGAGNPILGLAPADFRVRVGAKDVRIAAVDWIAAGAEPPAEEPAMAEAPVPPAVDVAAAPVARETSAPPGKLVLFFVQADNNAVSRLRGHLRTLPFTRELLSSLAPADRAAVVSFDSHLKLWQDFTRERRPVHAAIDRAIRFGNRPPDLEGALPAVLGRHFDFRQALRAASPERALEVTAEALAPLPGEKVVVFLGWGMGCFSSFGTQMTPAFAPAVKALKAARATVFVLDVTDAGSHDLEVGLRQVADATGGTYDKTNLFPALAVRQLARTISGYYVLALDPGAVPAAGGSLEVELRRRRGTVLVRPVSFAR